MSRLTLLVAGAGAAGVLLTGGCTGADNPGARPPGTRSPESSSTPSGPDGTEPTPAGRQTVADRCGSPAAPARWITLRGPEGSRVAAAVVGNGPVTAVFVHQTGGSGLCGFWGYSTWLADQHGVRSVLIDLCGYGESRCRPTAFSDDEPAQVALAVEWARRHGAKRTTLVGASLGGTVVSLAAAEVTPPVDAMVNLSGPVDFGGMNAGAAAPRIAVPSLLVIARGDDVATVAEYRRMFDRLGTDTKRLLVVGQGHGWYLLGLAFTGERFEVSGVGETVADWIRG